MLPEATRALAPILGVTVVMYVVASFALSFWARGRIESAEDYVVAGRRLPLSFAWATLFATWFGAGTLLTATDEVRRGGLRLAALDPLGAGVCLLLAGWFFAGRLWNLKLLTLADFFERRFGKRAELAAAVLMIPGYLGWIAAQFVALASVLELFFGIELSVGIALVAFVGSGYTLIGGMWSVTLTDAAQVALMIFGLVVLSVVVLLELGNGSVGAGGSRLVDETPTEMLTVIPTESLFAFWSWLGVFCVGALGNLPGQDLAQRIFAAKSARVAKWACLVAGMVYLAVGALPLLIGLAGNILAPDYEAAIIPLMASLFLTKPLAVIFLLAVLSAVLSTIDSAILSPATVLGQNILSRIPQTRVTPLRLQELSVVIISVASLGFAYLGEDAYELLETAYELGLVGLFVPLTFGLFWKTGDERAALAAMFVGMVSWLLHLALGTETFFGLGVPVGLSCAAMAALAYVITAVALPSSRDQTDES
jgi:Na+/proline symporter